jgi:hypothetical protein
MASCRRCLSSGIGFNHAKGLDAVMCVTDRIHDIGDYQTGR